MKISEDDDSWHASGVLVRDARADRPVEEVARHRGKKDCKKWCRGRVGIRHKGKWRVSPRLDNWRELICEGCNRRLDYCHSFFGSRCKAPNHGHEVPVTK